MSRYFFPDVSDTSQVLSDLAFHFAKSGPEVHVITSRQCRDHPRAELMPEEMVRGVRIHRVWATRFGGDSLLDTLSFRVASALRLAQLARSEDVVVARTDPPLLPVLAGRASRANLSVIENWADGEAIRPLAAEENPLRGEWGLAEKFVVGYSGAPGSELATLLEACERLADDPQMAFVFIGAGRQQPWLEAQVKGHGLTNVSCHPAPSRERLGQTLGVPDVHVVMPGGTLLGRVVSSNFYGVAAAGRPTVFVGEPDSDIPSLLEKHAIGVAVPAGDAAGLAATLRALKDDPARRLEMGARARETFNALWDKPVALARWRALLEEVARR